MRHKALFKTKELKIFKMDILNRKGIPIEVAKGLAKNFKLKSIFQQIYSLVIDYQYACNRLQALKFELKTFRNCW